jgi:DNA-binding NarL/FixJ family response regulator
MSDKLTDSGPRHPAEVEQADSAMPKVMGREAWHAERGASARDRGAEAIAAETLEDGPLRNAIFPRYKRCDGVEEHVRHPAEINWSNLSDRGQAILRLIVIPISRGFSTREVARDLGTSSDWVSNRLTELRDELSG